MTITPKNTPNALINPSFGHAPLSDWGLIFVEGVDAASFLQNQLTNSILGLKRSKPGEIAEGPAAVRLVGYCSPKGRLLASGWLSYQKILLPVLPSDFQCSSYAPKLK